MKKLRKYIYIGVLVNNIFSTVDFFYRKDKTLEI